MSASTIFYTATLLFGTATVLHSSSNVKEFAPGIAAAKNTKELGYVKTVWNEVAGYLVIGTLLNYQWASEGFPANNPVSNAIAILLVLTNVGSAVSYGVNGYKGPAVLLSALGVSTLAGWLSS